MKTSTLFLFASWALVVGCSGSGSSGGIADPNQPGGPGNPSPSPTATGTTDPPNPGGGGNVVIHIHANTKPFAHADSYAGQTPRDEYLGIRALVLGTSKDDPNPLVVFDHGATPLQGGATFVEARLNDGDDTVVATVPASKLRAGAYTWARTYVTHARYKVDATVHASGFATPGEYEDLVVLTDGTEVQGKKRQSGDLEATFRGGGQTYGPTEATMPIAGWAAGPFSFELAGGKAAYVYPVDVTVDPNVKKDIDVTFDLNMHECFRWEDQTNFGYQKKVWDVELTGYEPVRQFSANAFTLTVVPRP